MAFFKETLGTDKAGNAYHVKSAKHKALQNRKQGLKKDYGGVHPLAEHKSLRRNIAKQH